MNTIEILHMRDPDGGCDLYVYVDGVLRSDVVVEDVDPGRGWDAEDWDEDTACVPTGYTDAFRRAVVDARESAKDSGYIE